MGILLGAVYWYSGSLWPAIIAHFVYDAFIIVLAYFNPKMGLTGNEDYERPLYEILETEFSVIAKVSKEEITAVAADAVLAEHLNIHKGDPILKRKRFVFDPGRRPIEYNVGYYKSDSIVYTVESERD